jgi:hypothetical protein
MRFEHGAKGNLPVIGVGHQLTDRDVEGCAGGAEGDVAQEFLPDQLGDVLERSCVETSFLPNHLEALQTVRDPTAQLSDPDQFHAVVMGVPRAFHRSPKAICDTKKHIARGHMRGDPVACAKTVLNGQNHGIWPDHRRRSLRSRAHTRGFGGKDA